MSSNLKRYLLLVLKHNLAENLSDEEDDEILGELDDLWFNKLTPAELKFCKKFSKWMNEGVEWTWWKRLIG